MQMIRVGLSAALLLTVVACSGYHETGYLVHDDASYEAVQYPGELFGQVGEGEPRGTIAFDSEALDMDRNYLRYRIISGDRYLTVHSQPDPILTVSPGEYKIGVQAIQLNSYVGATSVSYGVPEAIEIEVHNGNKFSVLLKPDGGDGIELELVKRNRLGM